MGGAEEQELDTRAKPTPPHLLHGHSPLVLSREVDVIMRAASPLWARNSPDSLAQQRRAATPGAARCAEAAQGATAPVVGLRARGGATCEGNAHAGPPSRTRGQSAAAWRGALGRR